MKFYTKLLTYLLRKDPISLLPFLFFLLRWVAVLVFIYYLPAYSIVLICVYRLFMSNLLLADNAIFFNKNDLYLFDFRRGKMLGMFLFQRLCLNNMVYRCFYVVGILSVLVYLGRFDLLVGIFLLELSFFYVEYNLFKVSDRAQERQRYVKLIGETTFLSFTPIILFIFTNLRQFVVDHLRETTVLFVCGCLLYLRLFAYFIQRTKPSGRKSLLSFFYKKMDIFTYKELRLLGGQMMSNLFLLVGMLAFFLVQSSDVSVYMMLGAIFVSMLFLVKRNGEILNVKHDDYFLNQRLFSKADSKKILKQKFFAYIKISLTVKVLLVIAILLFNKNSLSLLSICAIFLLLVLFVVNEWNALYVEGRINFLLHHAVRYMFALVTLVAIYLDQKMVLLLLLGIFVIKEWKEFKMDLT